MNKNSTIRIKGNWSKNGNGRGYTWNTTTDNKGAPIPYNPKTDNKSSLPENGPSKDK